MQCRKGEGQLQENEGIDTVSYTVVIPSAGLGSRVGPYSKFLNKALITVGDKPVISRVIEKFPSSASFVILIGYKGDMVEEVVRTLHPDLDIEFVYVVLMRGSASLFLANELLGCCFVC